MIETYIKNIIGFVDVENIEFIKHIMQLVFIDRKNSPIKRHVLIKEMENLIKRKYHESIKNVIQNILDEGMETKIYVHNQDDDTYYMNESKYKEVLEYMQNMSTAKEDFNKDLLKKLKEANRKNTFLEEKDLGQVIKEAELILSMHFYENGISIFNKVLNLEADTLITDEDGFEKIIKEVLIKRGFSTYQIVEIYKVIKEFLINIDEKHISYIIGLLKKTMFIKVFNQINIRSDKDLLRKRHLYLDTNILISLLFENHSKNKEVRYIIKNCQEFGINLKMTDRTLEEYGKQFEYLRNVDRNFQAISINKSPKLIKSLSRENIDNDIYSYYLLNQSKFGNFHSFTDFYFNNIHLLLNKYNIEVEAAKDKMHDNEDNIKIDTSISQELREHKVRDGVYPADTVIEHDLFHLFYIKDLRGLKDKKEENIDSLGHKIWFLTLDKKLEQFRYAKKQIFTDPICITINELYDFLLPFFILENKVDKEYIKYQLSSNLGIYESSNSINLKVLSCIFRHGIDINQFNDLNEKEQKEFIYTIQSNKKIQRLCDKILENGENIEDSEKAVEEELKNCLKQMLRDRVEKSERYENEKLIQKLKEELEKEKSENAKLQEIKIQLQEQLEVKNRGFIKKVIYFIKECFMKLFRVNSKNIN